MLTDPTSGLGWSFGEVLTSAAMTTIANELPNAIDGTGGGTYTPTADITLQGAQFLNLMHLKLTTGGVSSVQGALTVASGGSGIWASGSVATFNNTPTFNLGFTVATGTATFGGGGIDITAQSSLEEKLFLTGLGQVVIRRADGGNADTNYGVNTVDRVDLANGILTGTHTYSVINTGAADGSEIEFFTNDTANILTISANGGALTFNLKYLSGQACGIKLRYDGSNWLLAGISMVP